MDFQENAHKFQKIWYIMSYEHTTLIYPFAKAHEVLVP